MENKRRAVNHDGMAGVIAALITNNILDSGSQDINDLALTLITPLQTY